MIRNVPMTERQAGYVLIALGLAGAIVNSHRQDALDLTQDLIECGNSKDALSTIEVITEAFGLGDEDNVHVLLHR